MIRDGEKIYLCSYAHCTDSDCICKSPSEELDHSVGTVRSSAVTLHLHKGFYHDCFRDIIKVYSSALLRHLYVLLFSFISSPSKASHLGSLISALFYVFYFSWLIFYWQDSFPHLIIAPNAGIAAYSSWSSTIVRFNCFNWFCYVYVRALHSSLLNCLDNCFSGANKRD